MNPSNPRRVMTALAVSVSLLSTSTVCAFAGTSTGSDSTSTATIAQRLVPVTVQLGASGSEVTLLQRELTSLGFKIGSVDGQFGSMTLAAVKQFQGANRLPVTGIVNADVWRRLMALVQKKSVSLQGVSQFRQTGIILNKQSLSHPYAFTYQKTTYMPLFYLMVAIRRLGIGCTWNGKQLSLTVPSQFTVQLGSIRLIGTGPIIRLNGRAVLRAPGLPYRDFYTHKMTEYMPIWYLQQALKRIGVQYHWDGRTWTIQSPTVQKGGGAGKGGGGAAGSTPTPSQPGAGNGQSSTPSTPKPPTTQGVTYTVYGVDGSPIGQTTSQAKAEALLVQRPGGYITDAKGNLTYTEPIPYAAYDASGHVLGVYESLSDVAPLIGQLTGAIIKDGNGQAVDTVQRGQSFDAYDVNHQLIGIYSTLAEAEQVLGTSAGGTVVDSASRTVYTVPQSVTYSVYAPSGTVSESFSTLTSAEAASQALPGTWVEDSAGNTLFWQAASAPYMALNQSGGLMGIYATLKLATQAIAQTPGGYVEDAKLTIVASQSQTSTPPTTGTVPATDFAHVDLRYQAPSSISASSINAYLTYEGSPLAGLGSSFIRAATTYGVDANYLVSHAALESTWGKSQIALAKNNIFGYGAYDSNPGFAAGLFPSLEYAILFQAWSVRNNYLTPGGPMYVSPTLKGMNVNYASDPHWAQSIGTLMGQFASYAGSGVSNYPDYQQTNQPPTPASTAEPIFSLSGATATVVANPNYGGLPYYPDMATGERDMFARTLAEGQIGHDVANVQAALNRVENAQLTVDGNFGPMTKAAILSYQKAHGLAETGQCNYAMWSTLGLSQGAALIPVNQTIQVDAMMQGLSAGYVVEWYHVMNYGWVDAQFVQFKNVYRVAVAKPTSPSDTTVTIYNPTSPSQLLTTLHAGDVVVSNNAKPTGGFYTVQWVDPVTGKAITGLISVAQASLTQTR